MSEREHLCGTEDTDDWNSRFTGSYAAGYRRAFIQVNNCVVYVHLLDH